MGEPTLTRLCINITSLLRKFIKLSFFINICLHNRLRYGIICVNQLKKGKKWVILKKLRQIKIREKL